MKKRKQKLVLTSYVVPLKSKGRKNISALITLRPLLVVTKVDGKYKPALLKLYEYTERWRRYC